jgi:hypothetical protein
MPGSTLTGTNQIFMWNQAGASSYELWIGNSLGGNDIGAWPGSFEFGGWRAEVTGLPTDGRTLYVRLWSTIGGVPQFTDATLTAANITPPAAISSPAPGSTLASSSQLFVWNDVGASGYQLWVGSTPGAVDVGYFPSGLTTATSIMVPGLPTDGRTLYVRLWSQIGGAYYSRDFTYQAAP